MALDRRYSEFSPGRNDNIYLYTKGGQFSLNGEEYVGEYHYAGLTPKTGPIQSKDSVVLQRLYRNPDHYVYDKQFNFDVGVLSFADPIPFLYVPTEQVYEAGFDTRYFVEKIEDALSYAIEIDEQQYVNIGTRGGIDSGLYTFTEIRWKLTGKSQDIINHNEDQIFKASTIVPSIAYAVRNYLEFARITQV